MQISRLFEIVYILLTKKTVTANELAQHFEVSTRTIYRDIENLSTAGIPVYMMKGKGGGISLVDNFILDKSLLSEKEQEQILAALQGIEATVYGDDQDLLSKISLIFNKDTESWIDVDFSDWREGKEKFNLIKGAILNKKVIGFEYFSAEGEKTRRYVEPLQLRFKEKAWYLKAYCQKRKQIRLFKLSRIKNFTTTGETFDIPIDLEINYEKPPMVETVNLKLKIQKTMTYRVYDEFDEEDITKNEDGSFIVLASYPAGEWVFGYILSFGSSIEVLEPNNIRIIIRERLQEALKYYK
ncbi:MAG: helix-turn-helix transcriptional regulator [Cellulosilyticaceae bacterium]